MHGRVLVDTSVWVSFFRRTEGSVSERLKQLLRGGSPVYTGVIATELIRGAKSKKELDTLDELFKSIEHIETKEECFIDAGNLGRLLLQKGITIGIVDLLIAQIAIENNVFLFTLDAHFNTIAPYTLLRLY